LLVRVCVMGNRRKHCGSWPLSIIKYLTGCVTCFLHRGASFLRRCVQNYCLWACHPPLTNLVRRNVFRFHTGRDCLLLFRDNVMSLVKTDKISVTVALLFHLHKRFSLHMNPWTFSNWMISKWTMVSKWTCPWPICFLKIP
jgi:hypothetical protein